LGRALFHNNSFFTYTGVAVNVFRQTFFIDPNSPRKINHHPQPAATPPQSHSLYFLAGMNYGLGYASHYLPMLWASILLEEDNKIYALRLKLEAQHEFP